MNRYNTYNGLGHNPLHFGARHGYQNWLGGERTLPVRLPGDAKRNPRERFLKVEVPRAF